VGEAEPELDIIPKPMLKSLHTGPLLRGEERKPEVPGLIYI
jgi:hypothetical protein